MYQALYRKYRPQTFDDVVGQDAVTLTLKNQVMQNRLSHAYLFTGTRGTGKTTCAKILAKAVNCENPSGGNPCNCCPACRAIDSGACMDVLEIDAASNNGVDSVRALRDEAVYTPAEVKKRVYIIDEVHMLSMSAFNALLKIMEEPPEHLLFILATTELHKVPATVLSRCQRFSFRRITAEDISARLQEIAYHEGVRLAPEAAAYLARLADGGLRDAVSLLDQCASAAAEEIDTEQICKTLGLAGARETAELMRAIGAQDSARALEIFSRQYADGKDLAALLDELCAVARDLLILRTAPNGAGLISGICTQEELRGLLPLFTAGELLRITSILRDAAAGFNTSANRRIDAELCLLRLCQPEAEMDAQSFHARISRLENRLAGGFVPAVQTQEEPPERPPWEDEPPPETAQLPEPPEAEHDGFWAKLVQRLHTSLRPPVVGLFSLGEASPVTGSLRGGELVLRAKETLTAQLVNKPNVLQSVAECASSVAGRPIRVSFATGDAEPAEDGFEKLLELGKKYPQIMEIK